MHSFNQIFIYGRVSSSGQIDNTSKYRQTGPELIAIVRALLHGKTEYKDHLLTENNIFYEPGMSAYRGKNLTHETSQWQQMCKKLMPNDLIVIESHSRFSRMASYDATKYLIEFFHKYNVKVLFRDIPDVIFDEQTIRDPVNSIINNLQSNIAHMESNNKRKLITNAKKRRIEEAVANKDIIYKYNHPKFFLFNNIDKKYELHPQAREIFIYIAGQIIIGRGIKSIIKDIIKKYGPKQPWGNHSLWRPRYISSNIYSISMIGKCPVTGHMQFPQILPDDLYQTLIDKKQNKTQKFNGKTDRAKSIFNGILYCDHCGSKFNNNGGSNSMGNYYACLKGILAVGCYKESIKEQTILKSLQVICDDISTQKQIEYIETNEIELNKQIQEKDNLYKELQEMFEEHPTKACNAKLNTVENELNELKSKLLAFNYNPNSTLCTISKWNKYTENLKLIEDPKYYRLQLRENIREAVESIMVNQRENILKFKFKGYANEIIIKYIKSKSIEYKGKLYAVDALPKHQPDPFWTMPRQWTHIKTKTHLDLSLLEFCDKIVGKRISTGLFLRNNQKSVKGYELINKDIIAADYLNLRDNLRANTSKSD